MKLRVVKFKNYGCAFTAGEDKDNWEHKFYWSFYELNSGKIIYLENTEYWEKDKLLNQEYDYVYAKSDLLNGDVHSYRFGNAMANNGDAMSKEFFKWFDSLPPYHKMKRKPHPTKEEVGCINEFYNHHVGEKKDVMTDTKNVMLTFMNYDDFKTHFNSFNSIPSWTKKKYIEKQNLMNFLNKHENLYYEVSQNGLMISTKKWRPEIVDIPLNRRGHLKRYRGLKVLMINISRPNQFKFEVGCYPLK